MRNDWGSKMLKDRSPKETLQSLVGAMGLEREELFGGCSALSSSDCAAVECAGNPTGCPCPPHSLGYIDGDSTF